MHPVVLMAMMMLCSALLGITGMFLSIPLMAAVKYYLLASDMPQVFLNPILVMIEGDAAGPHKNFVDKHRRLVSASAVPSHRAQDPSSGVSMHYPQGASTPLTSQTTQLAAPGREDVGV